MINVDISNIWGGLSLQDLLGIEQALFAAHASLGEAQDETLSGKACSPIQDLGNTIREDSHICVITGTGQDFLAARALIGLLADSDAAGPRILFSPETIPARSRNALKAQLEGKEVSVIAFGGPVTEESGLVPRELKWMLERRYGTDECARRFHTPSSAAGGVMLAMAAAGIDVDSFARGAESAREAFDLRSFENPVWLYTAVRCLMARSGKTVELLSLWEPDCGNLGRWWQQCFPAGEDGLFTVPLECPADLPATEHGPAPLHKPCFETMVRFISEPQSPDMSDGVSGLPCPDKLLEQSWWNALERHADRGIPIVTMECGAPDAHTMGWLYAFLELSGALSRRMPRQDQPAQEAGA